MLIEPQPKLVKKLKKIFIKKPMVKIIQKGVSDKKGKMKIFICEDQPGISTFSEEYKNNFPDYKYGKEETVEMTTLDDLIERYGLPKYCKIDVEGFELEALKGLTKPIPFISIEKGKTENEEENCRKLLFSKGYEQFNFPNSKDLFFKLR